MILFFISIFVLVFISFKGVKGYNENYLSFDMTNAIKGIFILLVFISHANPYIKQAGYNYEANGDALYLNIISYVGQWIVTLFLFYSGYGVMESIKNKGYDYIASFPQKRILPLLINFDIAVLLYIIIDLLLGKSIALKQSILSFIAWDSVGNSNWYIFVILICYFLTWVVFSLSKQSSGNAISNSRRFRNTLILAILLLVAMVVLSYFKGEYWYDTILCYGAGCLFSIKKKEIWEFAKRYYYSILQVLVILLCCIPHFPIYAKGLTHNVFNVVFALLIIVISMKLSVKNRFIMWLGQNLFPIYIYQRVPMIVLSSICGGVLVKSYPIVFVAISFVVTLLIAKGYKYITVRI